MERATFAAGCFWGVQATFGRIAGVTSTEVGYTGGSTPDPSYEQVCGGASGHAEAVQLTFDPAQVSYEELLATFWACHDPTTRDRQGPDVGSQYRSAVFYHGPDQRDAALRGKAALERSGRLGRPVVTEITAASTFFRAEEYHQRYLEQRGVLRCTV